MYQTSLAHQRPRGLTSAELRYVLDKREARVPDTAIAKMLGRPLEVVRSVKPIVKDEAPPPPPVKPVSRPTSMPPQAAEVFRHIAELHELTVADLSSRKIDERRSAARFHLYAELRSRGYSSHKIGR